MNTLFSFFKYCVPTRIRYLKVEYNYTTLQKAIIIVTFKAANWNADIRVSSRVQSSSNCNILQMIVNRNYFVQLAAL